MLIHCQNCQRRVNTTDEIEGCRSCSKPPPPPSPSMRPRFDAAATRKKGLDRKTFTAFRDGKLFEVPRVKLGDLLREHAQLQPEPKREPTPAIMQDDFFDSDPPLFT